jgi:hypothetical protein
MPAYTITYRTTVTYETTIEAADLDTAIEIGTAELPINPDVEIRARDWELEMAELNGRIVYENL